MDAFVKEVNKISKLIWPSQVNAIDTNFALLDRIEPEFMVMGGDLTQYGGAGTKLGTFKHYFDQESSDWSIKLPLYVGLGNHDLNETDDRLGWGTDNLNIKMQNYLREKNHDKIGHVPAYNFDEMSGSYSWTVNGIHFVQLNRFGGDNINNMRRNKYLTAFYVEKNNSLQWLQNDLDKHRDKPVMMFQHYGWDDFGTEKYKGTEFYHWWTPAEIKALEDIVHNHPRKILRFHGHTHAGDEDPFIELAADPDNGYTFNILNPTEQFKELTDPKDLSDHWIFQPPYVINNERYIFNPGAASPRMGKENMIPLYIVRVIDNQAQILLAKYDASKPKDGIKFVHSFQHNLNVPPPTTSYNPLANIPPLSIDSCQCNPVVRGTATEANYLHINLPKAAEGQTIEIESGAYNTYNWGRCNRILWDDLIFTCEKVTETYGVWNLTKGAYRTDNACGTWAKLNGPIIFTGNK